MALTQLATEDDRSDVFRELLDPKGSRISLNASTHYAPVNEEVSFASLVYAAHAAQELAIGLYLSDARAGERVRLNPPKTERFKITDTCKLIVLEANKADYDSHVNAPSPESMQGFS